MAQNNTLYPEPGAAADAMHPYQYPLPPTGHAHIPHTDETSIRRDSNESGNFLHANGPIGGGQGQPSTPQQLAQRSLDVGQGTDLNDVDSASRKRSKVSRACDECRRKKIRCDAESETSGTVCSACRRAGMTCDFTRAPQKRGPSKGYIKELAERVNLLEHKTGAAAPDSPFQPMMYDQVPSGYTGANAGDFGNRKRTYDAFDTSGPYDNNYNPIQAAPIDFNPRHQNARLDTPATSEQITGGLHAPTSPNTQQRNMNATVVNEKCINTYYELIHPLFPLLPRQVSGIQRIVENVPAGLCEAFFAALEAAITATNSGQIEPFFTSATKSLMMIQADHQLTITLQSKLVYLQSLILMIIATDNSGPSHVQSNRWFGLAIDVATNMKLHLPQHYDGKEPEPYTRGDLGRRCWLILFILDRWNAAGTCGQLRIAEENAKLTDSDYELLGESAYNMFRLSRILGHVFNGVIHHPEDLILHTAKGGFLNIVLCGEIETFRESIHQQYSRLPQIHLAYLYLQLLADRHAEPAARVTSIVAGSFNIVTLLRSKKGVFNSVLLHHITALTAITLAEIADRQTNPGAAAALQDLRGGLDTALFRLGKGKTSWDAAISGYITKKLDADDSDDRGGLGQLADAAVGKTTNEVPAEWSVATSKGYLNLFE